MTSWFGYQLQVDHTGYAHRADVLVGLMSAVGIKGCHCLRLVGIFFTRVRSK